MSEDDYWRRRALEAANRAEVDFENARARRLVEADDALTAVLHLDTDVLTDEQTALLLAALGVVHELRKTW
jgi:hypothetical protein